MPEEPPVINADGTRFDYLRNAQGVAIRTANLGARYPGSSSPLSSDGGSPAAVASFPAAFASRPAEPAYAPRATRRERREAYLGAVPTSLTSLAPSGGCAAKYPAARLEELLRGFVPAEAENLLVGLAPSDDAAVYKLDDERALVFTLDFFPPLLDDPALYGRIAATNALNDVFAMGGSPLLALSIAAFPESLPNDTLAAIFGAADQQVRAAGAILAGGHTLRDEEPKYGLAVVGTVHPDGFWAKSGARPGDALFLTKPLGTGMLLHAAREGRRHEEGLEAATEAMTALNRDAADALRPFEPNAVTDVTGFGLLGHAHEMAERSGVRIELDAAALPFFPGALEHAEAGIRTGGDRRNRDFAGPHVEAGDVSEAQLALAYDPQTAGGLLVALPADKGAVLQAEFASRKLFVCRVGHVAEGSSIALR
jgi:selenide,water dikinase